MAPAVQSLSIFAGSGFHDTGVELALDALGYRLCPVGYIERDASAAATLLARMATQTLGRAPVWCDCISRVDAKPLRGFVDLLIASPPCQPYSSAGKRKGNEDHRSHGDGDGPLVHLARIFGECRPAVGWFENVGEWFTGGHFREFGEELSRMGYDIQSPIFSSSAELGNVHERERVFCMVHAVGGETLAQSQERGGYGGDRRREVRGRKDGAGVAGVADANSGRLGADGIIGGREGSRIRRDVERGIEGLADADVSRLEGFRGAGQEHDRAAEVCASLAHPQGAGSQGDEPAGDSRAGGRARELSEGLCVPLCPPGRDDYGTWARLAAGGLDATLFPAIESGVSVVADALAPSASDLLRIGGNGVDPLVVADAFLRAVACLRRECVT